MSQLRQERAGSPTGLMRALFRAPIPMFRVGLGFLFGKRLIMLEHTGRRSGETRRTILEVVADHPDAVYVAAAWGSKAQWLKNIEVNPEVVFHLGSKRYRTVIERVDAETAHGILDEYAAAHPSVLGRLAGFMLDEPGETPEENASLIAEAVPLLRLTKE